MIRLHQPYQRGTEYKFGYQEEEKIIINESSPPYSTLTEFKHQGQPPVLALCCDNSIIKKLHVPYFFSIFFDILLDLLFLIPSGIK